jgi:carbamoyl-phosphate synthase small subunit
MSQRGFVVLESGETFPGVFLGGSPMGGEVVFNTSHSGYEEMATDPSYFQQILVCTAPQQGNYGTHLEHCESDRIWIRGFVCLEMYMDKSENSWLSRLIKSGIPILSEVDTRALVHCLREKGTVVGAIVPAADPMSAMEMAKPFFKKLHALSKDWAFEVSRKTPETFKGLVTNGPRVAVLDFGCKNNILRELKKRCSEVKIFPSRTSAQEITTWAPDGILLSNGPGDPEGVDVSVETIRQLLGKKFIFGICMGHQLLARAVGGKTYKLKFGHRGANHPIKDDLLGKVYVSSQNHGYAVSAESLPENVKATHLNLNDKSLAGMLSAERNFMSVQFHPESHPGPNDATELFDYFVRRLR